MSALLVQGYPNSGDSPERKKDRTQNKVIGKKGDACAEERQGAEQSKVARFGVHSRPRMEALAHPGPTRFANIKIILYRGFA
jgi:hypothetical protein